MRTRRNNKLPVFVTLGPSGTNHEMITKVYLSFREVTGAQIILVDDFEVALTMVQTKEADFIMMCSVHPQCASIVGKGSFTCDVHIVDVFISPSQPLGILTRKEVQKPRKLAIQPATANYTDITAWQELVHVSSIMRIAEGLLDGIYDSGLTTLRVAEENPGKFRIDRTIGSPDDAWIVLGRQRISNGNLVAWKNSPASQIIKQQTNA